MLFALWLPSLIHPIKVHPGTLGLGFTPSSPIRALSEFRPHPSRSLTQNRIPRTLKSSRLVFIPISYPDSKLNLDLVNSLLPQSSHSKDANQQHEPTRLCSRRQPLFTNTKLRAASEETFRHSQLRSDGAVIQLENSRTAGPCFNRIATPSIFPGLDDLVDGALDNLRICPSEIMASDDTVMFHQPSIRRLMRTASTDSRASIMATMRPSLIRTGEMDSTVAMHLEALSTCRGRNCLCLSVRDPQA